MGNTELILVGGFLGSGKTTLLKQATRCLLAQGRRVGLITNDQAPDLVDTEILRPEASGVEEIAGGCFCCRFSDLVDASDRLVSRIEADVLIGEPVGSCTDISATVLQPLKDLFADRFRLAPFSTLIDPYRLQEILDPRMPNDLHPSARYILRKQLEEADLVVINKIDLLTPGELAELEGSVREQFPDTPLISISAMTDEGARLWLDRLLELDTSGRRIAEVDYDTYAEGEAVLGWLNATVSLSSDVSTDWAAFCRDLLGGLRQELHSRNAEIAHVKMLLAGHGGQMVANLTRSKDAVIVRGSLSDDPKEVKLIINARAQASPDELNAATDHALKSAVGNQIIWQITDLQCLSPGRPKPTHRYASVVASPKGDRR